MREWMLLEFNGRPAIYWITPKAAHTLIVRLFRKKPWSVIAKHPGHAGVHGIGWMGELNESISRRGAAKELQRARRQRPLEFTFVREPLQQLISSAAQLHHCINEAECSVASRSLKGGAEACAAITAEGHLDNATRVLRLLNMSIGHEAPTCTVACAPKSTARGQLMNDLRRCSRHLWPQAAGYGFDGQGASRLQFVGRIERFREDWERLLTALGDGANHTAFRKVLTRKVNKRKHAAALWQGGSEWRKLRQEPIVRTWLAQHGQRSPLAVLWLGYCATTSGRAWWPGMAWLSQGEAQPLGAQPLPQVPDRAGLETADLAASNHPGSGRTTTASTIRGRRVLLRSLR